MSRSLKIQPTAYAGWERCLRMSNGQLELIVALDVGIRVLHFGFVGEENEFYVSKADAVASHEHFDGQTTE